MDRFGGYSSGNLTIVDKVPADLLPMVDAHWYQFPPLNPLWHSIIAFAIFSIGTIAMIGNYFVLNIFMTTKGLRTPSNLFVINLAFSDFCMYFTNGPAMTLANYRQAWTFGPLACELYAYTGMIFGLVSIWSMTMIAFDRYTVIVKGLSGKPLTSNGAILRILIIWILCGTYSAAPWFGWNRYVPEGNMTACGLDYLSHAWPSRLYIILLALCAYWTPLFLIIYSYFFILKAVIEHERNMKEQAKKMNIASLRSSENAQKSAEAKLAKVALVTISCWFVSWTPYMIINYIGIFSKTQISPLATIWAGIFAKSGSLMNPIVYGISHPRYRAALQKKYPALACANEPEVHDDTQSTATTGEDSNASA